MHARPSWQMLTKVPKIGIFFWVVKLLTTGMGEATSDYLAHKYSPLIAGTIGLIAFVIALWVQLRAKAYKPWAYWFAVSMVAVFGTMAADGLHVLIGVPYILSSLLYAVGLVVVFTAWYRSEHTLSIHSIHTRRRELFYWAAVLATFAMGTALGDLTAYAMHLGYFISILLFAGLFALPALGYKLLGMSPVFTFWFAYIITRPLGASVADWLGVPKDLGGLDLGRGTVSLVSALIIAALVGWAARTGADRQSRAALTPNAQATEALQLKQGGATAADKLE